MQNAFQRTQRSRMYSSSVRVKTLPVGLFGVLRIIALVFGPNAAANSFSSYDQKEFSSAGGRLFTQRGGAPLTNASGPEFSLKNSKTANSLPWIMIGINTRHNAFPGAQRKIVIHSGAHP